MAVLHGSWSLEGTFWIWGETWRKVEPLPLQPGQERPFHPFGVKADELRDRLHAHCFSHLSSTDSAWLDQLNVAVAGVVLPTAIVHNSKATTDADIPEIPRSTTDSPAKITAQIHLLPSYSTHSLDCNIDNDTLSIPLDHTPHDTPHNKSHNIPPKTSHNSSDNSLDHMSHHTSHQGFHKTPYDIPDNSLDNPFYNTSGHHSHIFSQSLPQSLPQSPDLLSDFLPDTRTDLSLFPWQVSAVALTPFQAFVVLTGLPLGSVESAQGWVGEDLRFWGHVSRWVLSLLARSKFLPTLVPDAATPQGQWRSLLDSASDRRHFERFVRQMPDICRLTTGTTPGSDVSDLATPLPVVARSLVHHFVDTLVDAQVRQVQLPEANGFKALAPALQSWLRSLSQMRSPTELDLGSEADRLQQFATTLHRWATPLETQSQSQFRTCLWLTTPDSQQDPWQLRYGLQADDDPRFWVAATEIWQHPVEQWHCRGRVIDRPQETLLRGLGLAARLYPRLEPALDTAMPTECHLKAADAYNFIKTVVWKLEDNGVSVVLPPSLANADRSANRLGLSIRAELSNLRSGESMGLQNLLKFKWELSLGGQTLSKTEFEKLVAQDTPLVQINGEWLELRPQDIRSAREFFASRKDQPNLSLEDALRISSGDTQTLSKLPVVAFEASGALQELVTTLTGQQAAEPLTAPGDFRGQLRPYQERGVGWLRFLHRWNLGACLADDMGLGKTIELIAFLLHLKGENLLSQPVLLVCPTSVLGNWEREVKRFAPTLRVMVHHGDKRLKGKQLATTVADRHLVLTSYALVHRDLADLQRIPWQGVVLDEAQNIKNADTKQSKAVRTLGNGETPRFRIALTGTPVENRLSELWSILDFLNPGYLGPRNFFQRRFMIPIERYGDTDSLKTLRSLVQPFILRRLKTDRSIIQDLPEKLEMPVFCGLAPEQANLYQQVVDSTLMEIEASEGIQRRGLVLALLTKLKQICNHPTLFLKDLLLKESPSKKDSFGALNGLFPNPEQVEQFRNRSAKLSRLGEMLEEVLAEGDRALIFTQFAEWGKLLQAYLQQKFNQEMFLLYGSTKRSQREEMVDRFQLDPQAPRIMILSLKAGGVGLNLTRANHVFHVDRWWNPAVENQATDRAFRIGQTRNVQVHKFVCQGTLEEKIHDLIESKKTLAEQVVGTGENWLTELNTDQLRNLLLLDRNAVIDDE